MCANYSKTGRRRATAPAAALKVMQDGRGQLRSPFWYTRFTRRGQKVDVSLGVRIAGEPPRNKYGRIDVDMQGDAAFEKSRDRAAAALVEMRKAARSTGKTKAVNDAEIADMISRYHKARTGKAIKSPRIDGLFDLWRSIARDKMPTAERMRAAAAVFARFAKFAKVYCRANGGNCETIDEVTTEIAAAWFAEIRDAYAWGTVKDQWHLMRKAWTRWHIYESRNPFEGVIVRNGGGDAGNVERRPLAPSELARLFDVTGDNPALHNLVVAAACTGMRIGDVCRLKWDDVDMRRGLVDAITAKTGVRVTIPIFEPLRKVFKGLRQKRAVGDSPFVFPEWAARYEHTNAKGYPDQRTGIVRSIKPYFARAVFPDAEPVDALPLDAKPKSLDEVLAAIDGAGFAPKKRERVREVYTRRHNGERCAEIAAALNIARGQVSDYLKDIENLTGEIYRPRIAGKRARRGDSVRDLVQRTRLRRKVGKHSASLFGWHNLRHTFVVLAIEAGVPVNDVSRIVGHGDVATTLDNYGNTSREVVAERVRQRMAGSVITTGEAVPIANNPGGEAYPGGADAKPIAKRSAAKAAERMAEINSLFDAGYVTADELKKKRAQILAEI